ncbi:GTP-binding protein [Patescibacteria group bacterium]|nr:GTP-binding protein [Patescibacteria group bacterium]
MQSRPPIIVVLGHVDHGKTTLLDAIRSADVASKEYGGITQGIGAYQVETPDGKKLTFIDTPGHEAFSQMRSRGANVADIAILVVAANDSVMPQTAESIKIIQAAKIPYIVAINKIDLPEANFDKVVKDLLRHNVLLETYGGSVPFIKISAKKKEGIKELLDLIGLVADIAEIKSDPNGPLEFAVIESKLDKNRGPVATLVIRSGSLKVGQEITIDNQTSKIRALIDYQGKNIAEAGPGTPVEVLGLQKVPPVGAAKEAKPQVKAEEGALNLILKTDTLGSLEALSAQIPANVNVLQSGTGEISEADVLLAKPTKAIILGFNVRVAPAATKLAQTEKVLVRTYKIIYELLDELKDAAAGMLAPETTEEVLGTGEIIAEFPYEKMRVAGTKVTDGRVARGDLVRVTRRVSGENTAVGESKIKSLRTGKEETNKVEKGKECGILLEPQIDFRAGDDIMAYRIV